MYAVDASTRIDRPTACLEAGRKEVSRLKLTAVDSGRGDSAPPNVLPTILTGTADKELFMFALLPPLLGAFMCGLRSLPDQWE